VKKWQHVISASAAVFHPMEFKMHVLYCILTIHAYSHDKNT